MSEIDYSVPKELDEKDLRDIMQIEQESNGEAYDLAFFEIPFYENVLREHLKNGFEPFAVTEGKHGQIIWTKRKHVK